MIRETSVSLYRNAMSNTGCKQNNHVHHNNPLNHSSRRLLRGRVFWPGWLILLLFVSRLALAQAPPKDADQSAAGKAARLTNKTDGAEMVLIPAGEFTMGSTAAEVDALLKADNQLQREVFVNEIPQHKVTLSAYYIYKTPVTVAQYMKFCAAAVKPSFVAHLASGLLPSVKSASSDSGAQRVRTPISAMGQRALWMLARRPLCHVIYRRDDY